MIPEAFVPEMAPLVAWAVRMYLPGGGKLGVEPSAEKPSQAKAKKMTIQKDAFFFMTLLFEATLPWGQCFSMVPKEAGLFSTNLQSFPRRVRERQ